MLIKLLCYFAKHHDPACFEVRFFVPESTAAASRQALPLQSNLQKLTAAGASIETSQALDETGNLLEIARKMADFKPDLLVTTAVLADYVQYFLACTRPAPLRIGLVYGPPEQYVPPDFDWVIAATKHPLIDSPCNGTLVPVEVALPDPATVHPYSRTDFNIPGEATLLVIVGRPEKFISREYWQALSDILFANKHASLLIVGIRDIPETCIQGVAPSILPRLHLIGYRTDYLRILAMADIVLDTFPSGGGVVLLDAMAFGIPVVTFRNDYSRKFDQAQWSPGEELFDIVELIVPRGDFGHFTARVKELITNPDYRHEVGIRCKESLHRSNGQPGRMVRRHEEVYKKVLKNFRRSNQSPRRYYSVALPSGRALKVARIPVFSRLVESIRQTGRGVLHAFLGRH